MGDAAVAGMPEVTLFQSLTHLARILRNACIQSTENQHRVQTVGALSATFDLLSAAVGMSTSSANQRTDTAGWVKDDAAGGGVAYIQARDKLLRACAQLGANALASNSANQCFSWQKLFESGLAGEAIKVADRRNDQSLIAATTTMVWYCVQLGDG